MSVDPKILFLSVHCAPGVSTHVEIDLLWDEAPNTCRGVVDYLRDNKGSISAMSYHGRYSGSEIVLGPLDPFLLIDDPDNEIVDVSPRDVGYVFLPEGSVLDRDRDEDFSEVCFFYDKDAQPRNWTKEGSTPVPTSTFGRIREGKSWDVMKEICYDMRRSGEKEFTLELVE